MDAASRPRSALMSTNPTSRRQNAIAATAAKPSHTPSGSATRSRRSAQRKPHPQASGISIYVRSPSQRSARGPPNITPARSGIRRMAAHVLPPPAVASDLAFVLRVGMAGELCANRRTNRLLVERLFSTVLPGASRPVGGEERGPGSCVGYSSVSGHVRSDPFHATRRARDPERRCRFQKATALPSEDGCTEPLGDLCPGRRAPRSRGPSSASPRRSGSPRWRASCCCRSPRARARGHPVET